MSLLIIASALSLLALDAAPAAASAARTEPSTAAAETSDYYNRADICTDRPITGSRFMRRVCITRAVQAEQERRMLLFKNHLGETVGYKPIDSNDAIPAN